MNFCDQTILSDPFADSNAVDPFADSNAVNPFADSNAVLASGTSMIQESDFGPKPISKPKPNTMLEPILDDLTDELKQSSESKIDEAIEMLEPNEKKNEQDDQELLDEKDLLDDKEMQDDLELKDDREDQDDPEDQDEQDPIEKLGSDDPVKPPTFDLTDESSNESSSETDQEAQRQSNPTNPIQHSFNDGGYQLPPVADVRSPISFAPLSGTSQNDPSGLLNDQNSIFQQRYVYPNSNYAEISGMPSAAKFKTWQAHNVYHRPTYFEDQNLELNGNQRPYQNVASAVSFFSTIPRLPYLFGEHHPQEKIYTLGQDRPGDPAPFRIYQPTGNRRGRVFQTIATLGLVLP